MSVKDVYADVNADVYLYIALSIAMPMSCQTHAEHRHLH
jgi:hypothetical protein